MCGAPQTTDHCGPPLEAARDLRLACGAGGRGAQCAITDEGLGALAALPRLSQLDLSRCEHVTGEGVRRLLTTARALTAVNVQQCAAVAAEQHASLKQAAGARCNVYL